jgi:hypothetical protein
MVLKIDSLRDPYRGNLLRWLERFTMEPLQELDADLHRFFLQLNPVVREEFASEARRLLEEAARYFGAGRVGGLPRVPPRGGRSS